MGYQIDKQKSLVVLQTSNDSLKIKETMPLTIVSERINTLMNLTNKYKIYTESYKALLKETASK